MRTLIITIVLAAAAAGGCKTGPGSSDAESRNSGNSNDRLTAASDSAGGKRVDSEPTPRSSDQPRTIRDFFMLLPEKYFVLEGCERETDKDCKQAKLSYLKTFAEVEDTTNGYLKAGCDGGQSCIEMTIFRRPDSTYLIAVATEAEMIREQYFLDHKNGQWADVAAEVIPEYSRNNIYELPRRGTTVNVFAKKVNEKGQDYEISEKGAKMYELVWTDGRFSIRK